MGFPLFFGPIPQSLLRCPLASNRQLPDTNYLAHPTHPHTRPTRKLAFLFLFLAFISSLPDLPASYQIPDTQLLNRRTHDPNDTVMRRALTTGLALYLGLGRVLSSPVQVQAPFELSKENITEVEVENSSASASELRLSLLSSCMPSLWPRR